MALALPSITFAFSFNQGAVTAQLGGFIASQGKDQHINIQSLIGNSYFVNDKNPVGALFGLGYFLHGSEHDRVDVFYGLNGFYLTGASVAGIYTQELLPPTVAYK